ncbi:MAG: monovalent cation/H(+) antiporter subunit G [Nocardiopsaceae bacterium]|nr:monovalent cation/H(+) antiporter subunit G [Nocardiopsaceae bacterium]
MIRQIITDVLLALAVVTVAASAIGLLRTTTAADRLHYVTPAAVVAPLLVAAAVFVRQGLDENTGETLVAAGFMLVTAPYLSHATIRAVHGQAGQRKETRREEPRRKEPRR